MPRTEGSPASGRITTQHAARTDSSKLAGPGGVWGAMSSAMCECCFEGATSSVAKKHCFDSPTIRSLQIKTFLINVAATQLP